MSAFQTTNPLTGDLIETYRHLEFEEVEVRLAAAQAHQKKWRQESVAVRAQVLRKIAQQLRKKSPELGTLITAEMGKPLSQSTAEIEKSAKCFEYYADNAEVFLEKESIKGGPYAKNEIHWQPLGVILSIMPWNFPVWQVTRFVAPSLLVGNTILLKHSDVTTGTAEILGEIFEQAYKDNLVFVAPMTHETSARVIAHPLIQGVTFTGSTPAGKKIAEQAGKFLKKCVLELGGSDAYLVLADADIAKAAEICAKARLINSGQSCVAAKRFVVDKKVLQPFLELFVAAMKRGCVGPLATKKFQTQLAAQVQKWQEAGGQIVLGGQLPEGPSAVYPPTVILFQENLPLLGQEEIFGPVATVIAADSTDQAVEIANSSVFGLGSAIFTKDLSRAEALALRMDCGYVAINDFVQSDPHLPFGGVKDSGYGRELSVHGLREFCNIKTVGWGS